MWEGFQREMAVYDFDGDGNMDTVDCIAMLPLWNVCAMNQWDNMRPEPLAFYNETGDIYYGKLINYSLAAYENEGIIIGSNIGRSWTSDKAVADYFAEYPVEGLYGKLQNGTTHKSPNTMRDGIYGDGVHYSQLGYNVQGVDIAENMYKYWYGTDEATTLKLLQKNGVKEVPDSIEIPLNDSYVAAPVVEPCSAKLTYEITGNAIVYNSGMIIGREMGDAVLTIKDQQGIDFGPLEAAL